MSKLVGLVGWRGMVGSVLMDRMVDEKDFDLIEPLFFSTSNAGGKAPAMARNETTLQDAHDIDALKRSLDELTRLRQQLDQELQHLQGVVSKLANRLQRRLMAQQQRAWEFDLEEGLLDPARLTRIVVDPLHPLSFKHEKDTNFRDTWRIAFGANYKYSDSLKLKFGIAHDQTPIRDADHRLVSLPDNDRLWLSVGAQWKPSKQAALDVGLAYLYVKDADINNNQANSLRGLVKGSFADSAWILGAQYSMHF